MNNRKAIALFIPSLAGGGAERFMLNLANAFASRGRKVYLIVSSSEGEYLSEIDPHVEVLDLKCSRVIYSIPGLVRFLIRIKPTALISTIYHANMVAIISKLIARVDTKVLVRESNMHQTLKEASRNVLSYRITFFLMSFLYRLSDSVIVVSQAMQKELTSLVKGLDEKIHLIYNFVDCEEVETLSKDYVNHSWLQTKRSKVILSAGRLSNQKNWPVLLDAFSKVQKDYDIKLIILGEGPERESINNLIEDLELREFVSLPGFKKNPYSWMSKSDIFILSSDFEGFPNVLVQALACGCKVISSDCESGPREILENGKWGRLFNVGDSIDLASKLQEALSEEDILETRERAEFFSLDKCLNLYENLL